MALSDLYSNGGQRAASPSPVPASGPVKRPRGPSPFRGLGAWLGGHLHLITLVLGVVTGLGFFAVRLTSDVPTDAAILNAVATASRTSTADALEGVADVRVGSCHREVTDDRAGDGAQQWSCRLSYTYAHAGAREPGSRTVVLVGVHAEGRTATVCLDCGPPLHFTDRGAPDRLEGGQFVHLPSEEGQS
ncbi:hypothetical protein KPL74_01890 [Bacillus sp. NP157]|nr:hypothetical protein KPL74_01890 [Bacillus sp. NP157]